MLGVAGSKVLPHAIPRSHQGSAYLVNELLCVSMVSEFAWVLWYFKFLFTD